MLLALFIFLTLFFFTTTVISAYFVYKWASIIFFIEDNLSEAIQVHQRSEETFKQILALQVIFDSPHVKNVYQQILEDVKICRAATLNVANALIKINKKQYIIVKSKKKTDEEGDDDENNEESDD